MVSRARHPAPLQKELAGRQCTIEGTGGKHLRAVPAGAAVTRAA